jgi:AcrR family transcriptional regulator
MTRIPAGERRAALVEAALRVVARHGVAAATTRAIVAEAGMSLASFHYAFESRDELMSELVTYVLEEQDHALRTMLSGVPRITDRLTDVPGRGSDPVREIISAGLHAFFDVVRQDPEREKAMFELTQFAMRTPGLELLAQSQYESYYSLAERAIRSVTETLHVHWDRSVRDVAVLLVALTDGLTLGWLVSRDDRTAETVIQFAADSLASLALRRQTAEVPA